jgi:hypothetical protein
VGELFWMDRELRAGRRAAVEKWLAGKPDGDARDLLSRALG